MTLYESCEMVDGGLTVQARVADRAAPLSAVRIGPELDTVGREVATLAFVSRKSPERRSIVGAGSPLSPLSPFGP